MRESIATALYDGLGDEPEKSTPVTRLAAFAGASRLGTALWRLKYAKDLTSYNTALLLLVKKLPKTLTRSYRTKIVAQALQEWYDETCRTCLGVRHVMVEDKKVLCAACDGLGKHRYSDRERAGLSGNWLAECSKIISEHDIETDVRTRERLER